MSSSAEASGGELVGRELARHGVRQLFTLCGGHISPILVGAKSAGLGVVDVRDEASAVFAADAAARLTGIPGVAAVTAGPGATNAITAVKNAELAQSPVLVLGGATATVLEGRGSLQDIDQMALMEPHVKWAKSVRRVRDLAPAVERALFVARQGVPGPVFLECPVDLLYAEATVRSLYADMGARPGSGGLAGRALNAYLSWHLSRLFARGRARPEAPPPAPRTPAPGRAEVARAARLLGRSRRPVVMVGSQALVEATRAAALAAAVAELGCPVFLSGMARGLLGAGHPLQRRHRRRQALRRADLVVLAGVPCDFRLDYGRQIGRSARLVAANRDEAELARNRRPDLAVVADAGLFLRQLAAASGPRPEWRPWLEELAAADAEREAEIAARAAVVGERVNPIALFRHLESVLPDEAVLVADGGDFVATASYVLSPRRPLSWLDPGVFGTLGVGGGFGLGAATSRPGAEVWILWGDGSAGYSLAEFDTFRRHGIPVVGLVGNDASWAQIAREQVEILGDELGTVLRRTDYHRVAEGYGGTGHLLARSDEIPAVVERARADAHAGRPVLINALLDASDFRKGSISM